MDRPIVTHLNASTPFLTDRRAQALCSAIDAAGHVALFVGGCVRNAIMDAPASDIDISTDALPQDVIRICKAAGFRVVPTGIDHGTVTIVVDGAPFEVTTFRRDVATDGRRAVVAFSKDVAEDARRRDFTMNALYADRTGLIIDPLGGLPDARARRVRFIEDAGQRIREDYLRTLRFFRFHAWYANPDEGWDVDALDGIAANLDGLNSLSAERVGAEMLKLLAAPEPTAAVCVMEQTGVLGHILPGATSTLVGPLVHLEGLSGATIDPVNRLAAMGGDDVAARLRLSRKMQRQLDSTLENSTSMLGVHALGHAAGAEAGIGALLLRSAMANRVLEPGDVDAVLQGAGTEFPVKSQDIPGLSGAALGARLKALKQLWLASDLTLTKKALLTA
ncbi:CCA tRNA nucleotidyltransferase [uncultured Tateyamaria sp.]|uniref:CCA tRNA nucleotidyltransferase n=1 Tax=uncultured Tateyamaria sp. TaxID=455651 RepID=UPI00262FB479|nr:CCA tRNA nucleotidyltransferase [uncultured Tateyamaria sp.]